MPNNIGTGLFAGGAIVAFAVSLLLFFSKPPSNCEGVKQAQEFWMHTVVNNRTDLRAEIVELLQDNACDGITPAVLRKVLLDMSLVQ